MNRSAWMLVAAMIGCGGGEKKPPPADPPTELVSCRECGGSVRVPLINDGIAQGVTITEIAAFQTLKIPLMKDNAAIDPSTAPKHGHVRYAGKRDGVLRVYLSTDAGWQPRPLIAVLRMITIMPSGFVVRTIASKPYTPKKAATDGDLDSTLNIDLPGALMLPDTNYSVTITDAAQGKGAQAMDAARWPRDGSLVPMGVRGPMDKIRVKLVPMTYMGQTPMPDAESYRKYFWDRFPGNVVEMTIREPVVYNGVMDGSIGAWSALLMETGKIRGMDNPDPDVYYYSVIPNTGGGGIAGLSGLGSPWSTGIDNADVAAHEVGHAHTLEHAAGGGAALGADMGGPYPDARIGVWGFNQSSKTLLDPNAMGGGMGMCNYAYTDLMSYCGGNNWISDYHYNQFFNRVESDNRLVADMHPTDGRAPRTFPRMYTATVETDGVLSVSDAPHVGWAERGEPRPVDVSGHNETGYWFSYDHIPGGFMMVPDSVRLASRAGIVRAKL